MLSNYKIGYIKPKIRTTFNSDIYSKFSRGRTNKDTKAKKQNYLIITNTKKIRDSITHTKLML